MQIAGTRALESNGLRTVAFCLYAECVFRETCRAKTVERGKALSTSHEDSAPFWIYLDLIVSCHRHHCDIGRHMLLPALSRAKFRAKTIHCTSNYRQWSLAAVMYVGDDAREQFPSAAMPVTGLNPWDVGIGFPSLMETYGMTVLCGFVLCVRRSFNGRISDFGKTAGRGMEYKRWKI